MNVNVVINHLNSCTIGRTFLVREIVNKKKKKSIILDSAALDVSGRRPSCMSVWSFKTIVKYLEHRLETI